MTISMIKPSKGVIAMVIATALIAFSGGLAGCIPKTYTAETADLLPEYHETFHEPAGDSQKLSDELSLYVDYSTAVAMGQSSDFFRSLIPSFVSETDSYYAIKGSDIQKPDGVDIYYEMKTIKEVNYADLKRAADMIASADGEGVLITDGEYFQKTIAGGNANNPYLEGPFKKWLLKGHDIYILSEPYVEPYRGGRYDKKRFYFIFTDSRKEGNIYENILQTVAFEKFPDVSIFHLSASHPELMTIAVAEDGTVQTSPFRRTSTSVLNDLIDGKAEGHGTFEAQEWPLNWVTIEDLALGAIDPDTGEALPHGAEVIGGIALDRNSYGGYEISDLEMKVYGINDKYTAFADEKAAPEEEEAEEPSTEEAPAVTSSRDIKEVEAPNFLLFDREAFKKDGRLSIYFDTDMYNPDFLTGNPYNYFRIEFKIKDITSAQKRYEEFFNFQSIDEPGSLNVSVTESIKQCLADPEIQKMMKTAPVYTIYVQSNKR